MQQKLSGPDAAINDYKKQRQAAQAEIDVIGKDLEAAARHLSEESKSALEVAVSLCQRVERLIESL